jgi:hypothetical protein
MLWLGAPPSAAQGSDPNPGAVTLTGGIDFLNAYYFRGIPQDETGVVMWPYADVAFALRSADSGLKSLTVNVGMWNSLHTGAAGLDGPTGKLWYESDFYASIAAGFAGGLSVAAVYTAYTSPNGLFPTVKEVAIKVSADDTGLLGRAAVKPFVLVARELDGGQADAGLRPGTYLEVGAAPGYAASRVSVAVPVRLGLSLRDYYEGFNGDERFGFLSVAGIVTVPIGRAPGRFGSWNLRGGAEYLRLGDRNQAFGETDLIVSAGIGLSY